jgi:hypothetical protein
MGRLTHCALALGLLTLAGRGQIYETLDPL